MLKIGENDAVSAVDNCVMSIPMIQEKGDEHGGENNSRGRDR